MSKKTEFIEAFLRNANTIARVMDNCVPLEEEYFDNGYNGGGGGDPIVDDDVSEYGIQAVDITNMVTAIQNLNKFFTNQAATTADYRTSVNQVRRAVSGE